MARKGSKKGGSSAARSAAAKKGWETRRRGGAKAKPAATKRTVASKAKAKPSREVRLQRAAATASRIEKKRWNTSDAATGAFLQRRAITSRASRKGRSSASAKEDAAGARSAQALRSAQRASRRVEGLRTAIGAAAKSKPPAKPKAAKTTARRGAPKTTSARGRALTNQRRAADLVRASRGGKGPSAKAVRSVLTAQRARAFYDKTGGGKKRSAVKAKGAAKIGKSIRAQGRAKATAARGKVAARAADKARTVAYFRNAKPSAGISKPAAAKAAAPPKGSLADTKMQWAKGDLSVHKERQKVLNQKLKDINLKIKEAGPFSGGLRLEKLKIQDSLSQARLDVASAKTRSKPAASAPVASRVDLSLDGFVRRQRRAKEKLNQIIQQRNRSEYDTKTYNRQRLLYAATAHLLNARREFIVGTNPRSAVLAGLKPRTRRR